MKVNNRRRTEKELTDLIKTLNDEELQYVYVLLVNLFLLPENE